MKSAAFEWTLSSVCSPELSLEHPVQSPAFEWTRLATETEVVKIKEHF